LENKSVAGVAQKQILQSTSKEACLCIILGSKTIL